MGRPADNVRPVWSHSLRTETIDESMWTLRQRGSSSAHWRWGAPHPDGGETRVPGRGGPEVAGLLEAWSGGCVGCMNVQWTHAHGRRRRDEEQGGGGGDRTWLMRRPRRTCCKWKIPQRRAGGRLGGRAGGLWPVWPSIGIKRRCLSSFLSLLWAVAIMWFILLLYNALPELVSAQGKSSCLASLLHFIAFSTYERWWMVWGIFNVGFRQFSF